MKTIGLIPARGGSKSIPFKNIKKLNGKPLIEYTIESALSSTLLDRVIVSTDDENIRKISLNLGADVPFLRPKNIAKDSSNILDTVKHTMDFLERECYEYDIIVLLQPTHPFRTKKMIDDSIKLLTSSNSTCVLSVDTKRHHPFRSFKISNKYLKPTNSNFEKFYQRQKLPLLYYPTGSIYTFWKTTIKKHNSIFGPKILPMISKNNEIHLDIDTIFDFFLADMTMKYWKNYVKL